jgi:hypothetical protein
MEQGFFTADEQARIDAVTQADAFRYTGRTEVLSLDEIILEGTYSLNALANLVQILLVIRGERRHGHLPQRVQTYLRD